MVIIVVRPPLGEVRIPRRTAARAHFLVINKGAGEFYLSSDTSSVQSQYFFPELEATNSSKSQSQDSNL